MDFQLDLGCLRSDQLSGLKLIGKVSSEMEVPQL